MKWSILTASLMVLLLAGVALFPTFERRLPPNSLPWRPVALDAPPGWLAHWQMHQLKSDGNRCRAALVGARIAFSPMADQRIGSACGYTDVVRLDHPPVSLGNKPPATCALAAALVWYQGLLQQAASAHMQSDLERIDHVGVFACRNVNNDKNGSRSQHAVANAIDVTSFHFADGRVANVTRDYGKPTPQGRFLAAAHDAACTVFNGVLGPDYNRLHATHFHLDMGPYGICR
ncbi:MAG: extensin family protein [Rhizobiales bacterium]|nr:extensin family protein [Hyphomicrobiales bacterium]